MESTLLLIIGIIILLLVLGVVFRILGFGLKIITNPKFLLAALVICVVLIAYTKMKG